MNSPLIIALIGAIAATGGGAGFYTMFTLRATKRKIFAEADASTAATARELNRSAMELMEPFRARVHELEAEVRKARQEATEARNEVSELRNTVADLTAVMRSWRAAILDPKADLDQLRVMVTAGSDRSARQG